MQATLTQTHVEPQTADTAGADHSVSASSQEQTQERRERRGRERPGRERQARSSQGSDVSAMSQPLEQQAHEATAYQAQPSTAAAPAAATTATAISMPKVGSYDLPLAQLQDVAQSSGLQWVNSNPERVAQIQAAIAAEPRPPHVPRERAAPVVLDEGPLILVETKRDLGQLHMPFENQ